MGGLQSACPTCRIASSEKPFPKNVSVITASNVQYPEFTMSEESKESLQQHFRNTLLGMMEQQNCESVYGMNFNTTQCPFTKLIKKYFILINRN
uniref:Uncharacterized protein n=1 Tax=Heterorhabditis bacteriophora TaxID=37862 RepID=A0A1I7W6X2_HETBA